VIIKERLYDKSYVDKWIHGFVEFQDFIKDYTPEWAEQETGIPANEIKSLAREISKVKPGVIFHYGYRCASHQNEIYIRRSILMLNALMGSVEAKGGIFFKKGPGAEGGKPARKLTEQTFPEITVPRFDKVGTPDFPLPDPAHGVPQILPYAILNEDPYPIKALINYRLETLMSIADTNNTQKALDKLDLIVTIDINYSDIAWYSDVILPESTYLERTDSVQQLNGLKPMMFLREKAVEPRYDTLEGPIILKRLGERLGVGDYFPYETMDELVDWQLEGTGFTRADFKEKGFVSYGKSQIFWDRNDIPFKTPSGKIEFKSSLLEDAGFPSFPPYESPSKPADPDKQFRLVVGRTALHTHISTQNVPYLNELMYENVLWINREKASSLGIQEGAAVEVASACGKGRIKAFVTDLIHPEAVFMAHGFGHEAKRAARSYNRGLSDAVLQENVYDKVGGSPAYHDTFVTVTPV
jgi:thiosulfate reductase/polysulfide reductase chain A